jgi:hypothetical protein
MDGGVDLEGGVNIERGESRVLSDRSGTRPGYRGMSDSLVSFKNLYMGSLTNDSDAI